MGRTGPDLNPVARIPRVTEPRQHTGPADPIADPEGTGGPHSELKVVEIPDDVEFFIKDYDGMEHVAEKHRTWR